MKILQQKVIYEQKMVFCHTPQCVPSHLEEKDGKEIILDPEEVPCAAFYYYFCTPSKRKMAIFKALL